MASIALSTVLLSTLGRWLLQPEGDAPILPTAPQTAIPFKASAAEVVAMPRWLMPAPAGPDICEDVNLVSRSDAVVTENWANATQPTNVCFEQLFLFSTAPPAHFHGTNTGPKAPLRQDSDRESARHASLSIESWLHQSIESVLYFLPCAVALDVALLFLLPCFALMLRRWKSRQAGEDEIEESEESDESAESEESEGSEESEDAEEHVADTPPFLAAADAPQLGCTAALTAAVPIEGTVAADAKAASSLGAERLLTPCRTTAHSSSYPCMVAEVRAAATAL